MGRWGLLIFVLSAAAPAQTAEIRNPKTTPEDVAAGGRIYRSHCAECHGLTGEGGRGPDLTLGQYRHGDSDEALLLTIMRGVPGTEMPGIYLEEHQVWQAVSFVRSLATRQTPQELPGDAKAGERLFFGEGGCAACHLVDGRGGTQGPDLSDVGGRRSPRHLRESLLEPSSEVRRAWWPYTVRLRGGTTINGYRLNEDTWSIRLLDSNGSLRSLQKADLEEIDFTRDSAMPPYGEMLPGAKLDDMMAYLASLRRK